MKRGELFLRVLVMSSRWEQVKKEKCGKENQMVCVPFQLETTDDVLDGVALPICAENKSLLLYWGSLPTRRIKKGIKGANKTATTL